MTAYPIPDAALDDRFAFVGTAGSGKTYAAGTAVERLLARNVRVGIVDPLGVWHGLRLRADGVKPAFPIVIFGGPYADLPLTEYAGALIGETAARMAESFILDLSELGTKAAERRFMLAFLTALYRKTPGEPLHLVFDEADMFAPQVMSDKDGDAARLLGMMETIVRRGRVKGFVPWLITQRPAVLSKNVLSQADGLIALKLTASQDRSALGDWIEGQADRAEGKRILGEMPTLQRGQAVVWLPSRGVLDTVQFPAKQTFDSSRTPARGEARRALTLKPLDVGALRDKLAKVEEETKANDPRALRAEIARLRREAANAATPTPAIDTAALEARAREEGRAEGERQGYDRGYCEARTLASDAIHAAAEAIDRANLSGGSPPPPAPPRAKAPPASPQPRPAAPAPSAPAPRLPAITPLPADATITRAQMKVIEALAFWRALGFDAPTRTQLGAVAGYSPSSGGFANLLSKLSGIGLIWYPSGGRVALTDAGAAIAPPPDPRTARQRLDALLSAPQAKIVDALPRDGEAITRADLAERTEYSATSGGFANLLSSLSSLGIVVYPQKGLVAVESWVWQ